MKKNKSGTTKRGVIGLAVMLVISIVLVFASPAITSWADSLTAEKPSAGGLKDGKYHAEDSDFDKNGYKAFVDMEVKDGAIVSLSWDEWDKDGNTKSVLSETGKYVMTEDGPTWAAQSKAVCDYFIKNGKDGIKLTEEGKTDDIAGVSIVITGFLELTEDCIKQASGGGLKDGKYHAEDSDFDKNGYKAFVDMEVKDGAIVSLSWDEWDKDGNTKSVLSETGKYVMTEDGPTWAAQSKAVCDYFIKNGKDGIKLTEEGKTDDIAGVSIVITGFLELTEDCIKQASGEANVSGGLKDGKYHAEDADFDQMGYKAFVDMEVKNGAIVSLSWDEWDKDGNTKSVLSETGKYVMTEDGPTWAAQSKAVCDYFIQNGDNGLNLNEEGKTDAIAGVSINIQGFLALTEDCLKQAAEEENTSGGLKDGKYHAEDADFDQMGYKAFVDMEVKNGAIVSLSWDEWDKDGNTKSVLSETGKYVMTEDGPTWAAQSKAVCDYFIQNGDNGLNLNEEGKTDAIAGVSINIQGFLALTEDCLKQAAAEEENTSGGLKDGKYHAEDADFDQMGYKAFVDMEVKDGAIVSLSWDEWDKDGNTKSVLSETGKYVMTEDGPTWAAQSKAVCDYFIQNGDNGLNLNEEGKTDAIAGVSINIQGFLALTEDCLKQAAAEEENTSGGLKDGKYHAEDADFDQMGYKAFVDMEVKNGAIVSLSWDEWDKDGNTKSVLSETGKYVMTEDGPTWAAQSKAVCDYFIQNGDNGLNLNEEGKTDAVAGVSINIQGFLALTEDCLKQASAVVIKDGYYHAEDADFDQMGYKAFVDMEIKDGAIVKLVWDEYDKDGEVKSILSETGKYVMTEDGLTWYRQSKAICKYYIENGTNGLNINEDGKTDAVAGVSIDISGFIALVGECLENAAQ